MKPIFRNVLAAHVGLLLGGGVNMALVLIGPHLIAPPPGVNMGDTRSLVAAIHLLEPKHFLFPFLAHALGTLAGAIAAHLVASTHRSVLAYLIGALFLIGGISAAFIIPAPVWFITLDLVVAYLPMAWLGIGVGRRLRREGP